MFSDEKVVCLEIHRRSLLFMSWQVSKRFVDGFQKCQCCKCRQAKVETTATNAWSDGNWSLSWSTPTCRFTSAIYIHFSILGRQFFKMLTFAFTSCKHPRKCCNQIWIPTLERPYLPHIALLLRRPDAGQKVCLLRKAMEDISHWTKVLTPCGKFEGKPWFKCLQIHEIPPTSFFIASTCWTSEWSIDIPTAGSVACVVSDHSPNLNGEILKVSLPVGQSSN